MPLVNHAFARVTPAMCVVFTESEQESLVLRARTQIRHVRRFRQNPLFLASDKDTVYQKHGFLDPEDFLPR